MSADAIGYRYLQAASHVGVRAISLWVARGAFCSKCPVGESGKPRSNKAGDKILCDRCDAEWEPRSQWVLKSGVSRGHPETHRLRFELDPKGRRRRVIEPRYAARPGASRAHARGDATDLRLARHVDRIRSVQAIVETVPPAIQPTSWCYSISAWLALLLLREPAEVKPFPGYDPKGEALDRVCLWGSLLRPHLGTWEKEPVEKAVEHARRWVRWRAQEKRWREGEAVEEKDWLKPSEVAGALRISERAVYDLVKDGVLEAFERGRPDAKRRTIGITRRSVELEMRRRNIRECVEKTREFLDGSRS